MKVTVISRIGDVILGAKVFESPKEAHVHAVLATLDPEVTVEILASISTCTTAMCRWYKEGLCMAGECTPEVKKEDKKEGRQQEAQEARPEPETKPVTETKEKKKLEPMVVEKIIDRANFVASGKKIRLNHRFITMGFDTSGLTIGQHIRVAYKEIKGTLYADFIQRRKK